MMKAYRTAASPVQGMVVAALTFFFLSVMQVFAKLMGDAGYHAIEVTFYRNGIGFVLVSLYFLIRRRKDLVKTQRPGLHLSRGLIGTAGLALTFAALHTMPMSETTIFLFSSSLLMPVLAILFLKDHVGIYRWGSILVGFGGVALMAQPSEDVTFVGAALALSAAFTHAVIGINLRSLGRTEHPMTVVFYFLLIGGVLTALAMPFVGHMPAAEDLWMIAGVALSGTVAQVALTLSYTLAPPALVAPFNYTGLIWALMFDVVIWAHVPGWPVFLGGFIVVASNLFLLYREHKNSRLLPEDEAPGR